MFIQLIHAPEASRQAINRPARWHPFYRWLQGLLIMGTHPPSNRHAGNQFAAESKAGLKDLMARMGHDSERAAMIYQHKARGADQAITNAIDSHVERENRYDDNGGDDSQGDTLAPTA